MIKHKFHLVHIGELNQIILLVVKLFGINVIEFVIFKLDNI